MVNRSGYGQFPGPIVIARTSVCARNGASSHIPPELITQITQSVIKQLQTGGLDAEPPLRPSQNSFLLPPHPLPQPIPQSPSNAPGTPPTMPYRVYDPPSLYHPIVYPSHTSPQSELRCLGGEQKTTHFTRRRSSPPSSQSSETSERYYTSPKGPSRLSTEEGIITLERIWGPLFDEGRPTLKLGQLLRGLAVHIIRIACGGSVREMLSSIDFVECRLRITSCGIISSSLRQSWHNTTTISSCRRKYTLSRVYISSSGNKGSHRWYDMVVIFDGNYSSLLQMYRDLKCPHHLVQEKYNGIPDIPGLTPVGFER